MCGRYNISDSKHVEFFAEKIGMVIDPIPTQFNIAPTETVPVIYKQNGAPAFNHMRWWLVPNWSSGPSSKYAMFNARAESLAKSRAYQKPFKQQRAIIPASSFIEWKLTSDGKQPYLIEPEKGGLAFAGLWDYWTDGGSCIYSCSIITTESTGCFSQIHKRMPVKLEESNLSTWLDTDTTSDELQEIIKPKITCPMIITPIGKSVNNSSYKGPIKSIAKPFSIR